MPRNMSREEVIRLDKTTNSGYCIRLLLFTIASSVPMISYGVVCLNPATPVMQEMYNESTIKRWGVPLSEERWNYLRTLTISIFVIGAFVGCFFLKAFLLCLPRRRCLLAAHYINVIGGSITCTTAGLTRSYEPIIIGRFISGMASGMALGIVPVIIGETSVKHRCQFNNGLIGAALALGTLLGMFFGWPRIFGTSLLWPLIPLIPTIPSFVYILLSIPETPYQIMKIGDRSGLRKLMRKLREGSEDALDEEIRLMCGEAENSKASMSMEFEEMPNRIHNDITLKEALGIVQYRRQFLMVPTLFAGLVLSGWNFFMLYTNVILLEAGFDQISMVVTTLCLLMFQVIATLPGKVLLHRIGSWMLFICGNLTMILGHILVVLSVTMTSGISWLAALGVAIYFLGFAGCANIAIFPLASELTIEKTRAISFNFGSGTYWLTTWLVGFCSSYFQDWWGTNTLLIWTAFTIGFTVYIMILVPNTKKLTSAQVQERFAGN